MPDLTAESLAQRDLRHADFHAAQFGDANLTEAKLEDAVVSLAYLTDADLTKAHLDRSVLHRAWLIRAKARRAKLCGADVSYADLTNADFKYADLREADLRGANLTDTDLRRARLNGADLSGAVLVRTRLQNANLEGCRVYGASAWDLCRNEQTVQRGLVVTPEGHPIVEVDDLEVAQFIYLLSKSDTIRRVLDAIQSKGVLLIGRFTKERLEILHAIRDELREGFALLPIMFEFDPQARKPTIDTLLTLAHMSRFVIADLTDAMAVVQELTKITDSLRTLPIKLIMHKSSAMPSMADSLLVAESVLKPVYVYSTRTHLLRDLDSKVVGPANKAVTKFEAQLAQLRRRYLPWQNGKALAPGRPRRKGRPR